MYATLLHEILDMCCLFEQRSSAVLFSFSGSPIIFFLTLFDQILNTHRSFVTDFEKDGISSNLQQTEEWLYEDGADESEYVYTERLKDLKKVC